MAQSKNEMMNEETKACVMTGYYDEDGEYREEIKENIYLNELPPAAVVRVDLERYDITVLYSKNDVMVVAKSVEDIKEYKYLGARPQFFHGLLAIINYAPFAGYMCIVSNLKVLRKRLQKNRSSKEELPRLFL